MQQFERCREDFRVKIRREKNNHEMNKARSRFIESVNSPENFKFVLRSFMMNMIGKNYDQAEADVKEINEGLYFLENQMIRDEIESIDVIKGLMTIISKVQPLTLYKLFQILVIMSEFECFLPILISHINKIFDFSYSNYFNLCCVIYGNLLFSKITQQAMLDFIINQQIQGRILLKISTGKKYPLQHWLKFCIPYRTLMKQKGFLKQFRFLTQIDQLCISTYLNNNAIQQINQTILQYLSNSNLYRQQYTYNHIQFAQKVSKSKYYNLSIIILQKISQSPSFTAQYINIQNIFSTIQRVDSSETIKTGTKAVINILKNTNSSKLAQQILLLVQQNYQYKYLITLSQNQAVDLVRVLFIQVDKPQYKVRVMRLVQISKMNLENQDKISRVIEEYNYSQNKMYCQLFDAVQEY